jgi:Na+/H+-dicarboxylate symporter
MSSSTAEKRAHDGGLGGLIAIVAALILGVLVGVFYGRTMWLASGGPAKAAQVAGETIEQKQRFAEQQDARSESLAELGKLEDAARAREEAERLRKQVAPNMRRRTEMQTLAVEAEDNPNQLAAIVYQVIAFCGDLFIQVLKLLVIPLVMTSMIVGITSLGDIRQVGKVGAWTLTYYLSTVAVAVVLGIVLVQMVRPGEGADDTFAYVTENVSAQQDKGPVETLLNVVRGDPARPGSGMFPSNIFQAATETNVLALIVFSLVFGGTLTTIGSAGKIVTDFFYAANLVVMKMVLLVMWFAPIGIFGLVAAKIAENGGGQAFYDELSRLSWYVGTVCVGLAIHFAFLTLLLAVLARRNPFAYLFGVMRALLTAVTTASSSATLPITMECVEENNGVSNRSASFVLPLGATINMDGTALYEAVAVIFIAQSSGIILSFGSLVVIFLTATLAAVGAAAVPSAGLFTMVIVLTAVGLPIEGIGMILAIDWFLDRLRTTVNVYGDAVGAGIIDHYLPAEAEASLTS